MPLTRAAAEGAFYAAAAACQPEPHVRAAMARVPRPRGQLVGIAIGKEAIAMSRAVDVDRGIVVSPFAAQVSGAWQLVVSAHPIPDDRSLAAAHAVKDLVASAAADDLVLALISGGTSALIEDPRIPLADFNARITALMHAGAPIDELNRARTELSAIKGGKLVAHCAAPVVTLAVSDVIGDRIEVIGSGPTIARDRPHDRAEVVVPMRAFAETIAGTLGLPLVDEPLACDVHDVAVDRPCVRWGEPTVTVPADHGRGGRAQQLALHLARQLRGGPLAAFAAGSDGVDGAGPAAGAFVDGTTWDAIAAAGIDPAAALARRDAGTALGAIGALFVSGPTGLNHADIVAVG